MQFEWDSRKANSNLAKHGVAFEVAELVWNDPAHVVVFDRHESGEERWQAIGLVRGVMILTVIHTNPGGEGEELVRLIGARKATLAERDRYEAQDD
jgi:uncharacterized protein